MRMLTAYTCEVDDLELAASQILEQLDLKQNRGTGALGLLSCHPEFVHSGVVKAVCDALDFDVVGCTTISSATVGAADELILCLAVLTGDDVQFSTALTDSMGEQFAEPIEEAYRKALDRLPGAPGLVIPYAPLLPAVGGEAIMNEVDRVVGGVPVFGTVAIDHTLKHTETYTIYNGEAHQQRMCLALISGEIHPRFVIRLISEERVQKQRAVITQSQGSMLMMVNDVPLPEYLKTLGLDRGDGIEAVAVVPFIVDYGDGTQPVARAIYMVTPEGYAVCGGTMPEGATLAIGSLDQDDVLLTARQAAEALAGFGLSGGMLMFPCMSRNMVLGADVLAELNQIQQAVDGKFPYHIVYSGGEMCPVQDQDGQSFNRFHNFSIIGCAF